MSVGTSAMNAGFKKARKSVKGFGSALNPLSGGIGMVAGKLAALAGVSMTAAAAFNAVKAQFTEIDAIAKTASKLGIASEELVGLRHAAEQSGVGAKDMEVALQRMTRRLADAANGSGSTGKALKTLGLDAKALGKLTPDKQIREIADAFTEVESQGEKVRLAFALFDSGGVGLINTLAGGSAGLDAMSQSAKDLGISFTDVEAGQIEMANDAIDNMSKLFTGLFRTIAIEVAPLVQALAQQFTTTATSGMDMGTMVSTAMGWIVDAIAIAADVIDVIHDLFGGFQAAVTFGISLQVKWWSFLGKGIEAVLNLIPGLEVSFTDTLDAIGEDLEKLSKEQWAQARKDFEAPPPSVGIKKWFADVKSAAEQAAKDMKENSAGKALADSFLETNKPALAAIKKLNEEILTLKLGADAAKRFSMEQDGVDSSLLAQIDTLQAQKKALAESKKHMEDLESGAKSAFENTRSPLEKFQTKFQELQEMLKEGLISDDVFKKSALDALPDKVKSIIESTKSPVMKFQEQLKELQGFRTAGLINTDQLKKATQDLKKDIFGESKVELASAAELGSSEARSSILKNRLGGSDPISDLNDTEKANLIQSNKQTGLLSKISSNLSGQETLSLP